MERLPGRSFSLRSTVRSGRYHSRMERAGAGCSAALRPGPCRRFLRPAGSQYAVPAAKLPEHGRAGVRRVSDGLFPAASRPVFFRSRHLPFRRLSAGRPRSDAGPARLFADVRSRPAMRSGIGFRRALQTLSGRAPAGNSLWVGRCADRGHCEIFNSEDLT